MDKSAISIQEHQVSPGNQADPESTGSGELTQAKAIPDGVGFNEALILMACSATKRETVDQQALPLIELYDGPMWQTLRTHLGDWFVPSCDPRPAAYRIVVLSGRYGIVNAHAYCRTYEARLSAAKADALILAGLFERQTWFGELDGKNGLAPSPLSQMQCRTTSIKSPEPLKRVPWRAVIVAGGGDYRRVFLSLLTQLRAHGDLSPDAAVLVTRGGIGQQRAQLGAWVDQLRTNSNSQIKE